MFNNINNNNNDFLYNSQLEKQSNIINMASIRANMNKALFDKNSNPYVDKTEISSNALELFQKDLDIKKFTQIMMSAEEYPSSLEEMKKLFSEGVIDIFSDDVISQLVENSELWKDLGL